MPNPQESSAKSKSMVKQISIGTLLGILGIAIQHFLTKGLPVHSYLILLVPSVVIASYFGGGLYSGISASLVTTLGGAWLIRSTTETHAPSFSLYIPAIYYLFTNLLITFLIELSLKRERESIKTKIQQEEDERLRFASMSADFGIWEWEFGKDIMHWDNRMLELYGITRSQFTNTVEVWQNSLHPEDRAKATEAVAAAIRGEKDYNLEFRIVLPDGKVRHLHGSSIIMRDSGGKPWKMFGLNRDITEEKATFRKIQELTAFFKAALTQTPAGIIIVDAESGNIRFINEVAAELLEQSIRELEGIQDFRTSPPFRIHDLGGKPVPIDGSPLNRCIAEDIITSQEFFLRLHNGHERVVLINTAPIKNEAGQIIAGIKVFVDTTKGHRLLNELKLAKEVAESAMRAKARFLDIAAHELRTPVTAFSVLLEITEMRLEKGTPVGIETLKRLRAQVKRLSRLVADLLEVARLEKGTLSLRPESANLIPLIQESVESFSDQFPDRPFHFHPPRAPVVAVIDPVRIHEVLTNIIDNAVKYTPSNSPIRIHLKDMPDQVRISVSDQGPGISGPRREKLFQAFERGVSSEVEKYAGLGLGLFISKGIMDLHHGKLDYSPRGAGSEFRITLPKKALKENQDHGPGFHA